MTLLNTAEALFIADREAHRAYLGENEVFVSLEAAVRSFFANGEPGVWFDNAALDTMYEDSAGTTPAVVNGLVGLQRSKARNGATGATLTAATWTNASWDTFTSSGNGFTASKDVAGGTDLAYSNETLPVVLGRLYRIDLNVTALTAASFRVGLSSLTNSRSTTAEFSDTGAKTCFVRANVVPGNCSVAVSTTLTGSVSVDSVVVTEILDHYRYQDATAFKPILRGTPVGADVLAGAGTFDSSAGWTLGTGWSIAAGVATHVGGTAEYLRWLTDIVVGRVYRMTFTVTAITSGASVSIYFGNSPSTLTVSSVGTYVAYGTAVAGVLGFAIRGNSTNPAHSVSVDNVEVHDVSADAVQAPYGNQYDGIDDFLQSNTIDFTSTDAATIWGGYRLVPAGASGVPLELSASLSSNNGTFAWIISFPSQNLQAVAKGTAQSVASKTALTVPRTLVVTQDLDISADRNVLRIDGVQEDAPVTDQGTGNLGNYPMYFGRRGGSAAPFAGLEFQIIVRGAASTATQIADGEALTAHRTGVTLP